ncbi:hypothetical protein [Rahnella contaminans]|uniref:hypothetical protein n=1 Tax=Rahnella contaminans TaxID=2703882 RepID=UPI003C2E3C01
MSKATRKVRENARKRANIPVGAKPKQMEQEDARTQRKEVLLSAEAKARLIEMRTEGVCPPNTLPTVQQYPRYAAFKNSQAAASRARAMQEETSLYVAEGGVMGRVFERLNSPPLKDTPFAVLATLAVRLMSSAPSLVDEGQRIAQATDGNNVSDDELAGGIARAGVDAMRRNLHVRGYNGAHQWRSFISVIHLFRQCNLPLYAMAQR